MKLLIVIGLLVAAAAAAPAGSTPDADAITIVQESDNIGVEGYRNAYETSNGLKAFEEGAVRDVGTENEGIEVSGSYSYLSPDGVVYTVNYTAGRNGFIPSGAHIPQAP